MTGLVAKEEGVLMVLASPSDTDSIVGKIPQQTDPSSQARKKPAVGGELSRAETYCLSPSSPRTSLAQWTEEYHNVHFWSWYHERTQTVTSYNYCCCSIHSPQLSPIRLLASYPGHPCHLPWSAKPVLFTELILQK